MAGSLAWYTYSSDDDTDYGVLLDEDIGSQSGLGFVPVLAGVQLDLPPKGHKMRYVNAVQTSGAGAGFRYRSFPCGTVTAELFQGDTTTFVLNGLSYEVTSTRGERFRRPRTTPSGLVGSSPTVGVSTGGTVT